MRASIGYVLIVAAGAGLAMAVNADIRSDLDAARNHYIENAHADAVGAATRVEDKLRSIYENIRTLTFLPSVRNIDRHGTNLSEEGRATIQQVYNNLASNVAVSEVYIVPESLDPDKIDPVTGKPEEPILMFDELIVNAASHRPTSDTRDERLPKYAGAPEVETFEYRQLKQQIAWLRQNFATSAAIDGLQVPVIGGPEVITCDNSKYIYSGRDADRSGIMFSMPFFDKNGLLKGTVTAIMRSEALANLLPARNYALVNHGYGYTALSPKQGQERASLASVAAGKPDPSLIYSEVLPVSLNDPQSGWSVWSGQADANFYESPDVETIQTSEYSLYAVIATLMASASLCWWLIVRTMRIAATARAQLEQRVDERTREIGYLATHDVLTGLPNRALLKDKLKQALASLGAEEKLAVLYIDLDHFKQVNDTLGHGIGDALLTTMVARMRECVHQDDLIARLGGDEFVVVQQRLNGADDADRLARSIVDKAAEPFDLEGHRVVIGASIGIAVAPADGDNEELLLKNADMALYRAKGDGRGTLRYFEPSMDARLQERRRLEVALRRAVAESQFTLHYQPQVISQTGEIVGFEALVRWNHPERGLVSPLEFIPLAEEIGLIAPLGEWVLRTACRDAMAWPRDIKVAVNLSPLQFKQSILSHIVVSALAESGLPAHRLELEITETVLLAETGSTLATLHHLRSLGVRIAMDDFGTGYSSLSYLRLFPFDKIKIDRSFVRDLDNSADCVAIVKAIAGLGSNLGMATTAEGVETKEQLATIALHGYTEVQGYYFSEPKPAADVLKMLAKADAERPPLAISA